MAIKQEIKIATPVGMVGYGYTYAEFEEVCMQQRPDYIIADAGSTDSGPQKLALGVTTCPRASYEADLGAILQTAHKTGARVLIGSAGGDGTNAHVDLFIEIIEQICKEKHYSFKVRSIYSDISRELILDELAAGTITPCGPVPALTVNDVHSAGNIVAQMGAEPFITALKGGFDVIIGGRSYDPAMYAAAAIFHGIDPATAWHMGKINECGGQCSVPKSRSMITNVRPGSFDLLPIDPNARCTPLSVAAHTLYEKTRPDILVGPGGILNLATCAYEAISDRDVRVSGASFKSMPYTVKLEGAKALGFRTMIIGGIRDPFMQASIDLILPAIVERLVIVLGDSWNDNECKIVWHVYGKDGIMGPLEPEPNAPVKELCIMAEALAPTQDLANRMANLARVYLMHTPYPGQLATAASFASPVTPLELPLGQVCAFNIYHIMPLKDPEAIFTNRDYTFKFEHVVSNGGNGSNGATTNGAGVKKEVMTKKKEGAIPTPHADKLFAAVYSRPTVAELISQGRTTATLAEIAQVVRTKNAGPFELTLDVMFSDRKVYDWVKSQDALNLYSLSKLYNVDPKTVCACLWYEPALAFKFTIPRAISQGSFGETDMHGCQQHIPLLNITLALPTSI